MQHAGQLAGLCPHRGDVTSAKWYICADQAELTSRACAASMGIQPSLAHILPTFVSTGKSFRCSESSMMHATLLRPKPASGTAALLECLDRDNRMYEQKSS